MQGGLTGVRRKGVRAIEVLQQCWLAAELGVIRYTERMGRRFRLPPMHQIAEVLRGAGLGAFDLLVSASIEHQRTRIADTRRQRLHLAN